MQQAEITAAASAGLTALARHVRRLVKRSELAARERLSTQLPRRQSMFKSLAILQVTGMWLALLGGLFPAQHALGDDAADPGDPQWLVAPYLWAVNLDADVGIGGFSVPLEARATELFSKLGAGFMGYARRTQGERYIYLESLGMRFEDDSFDQFFDQGVKADLAFTELGYGRHIDLAGGLFEGGTRVSPYLGVRYARLEVRVQGELVTLQSDEDWLDPAIGVVISGKVRGPLSYVLKFDGAGFDIDQSRYWNALAALHCRATPHIALSAGYRWATFRAEPGGGNDLSLAIDGSGPTFGFIYTFGDDE